ncbi:MAG: TRAP transporter small permease [Burkholderiales bacterium]|nr:TRAP transporter small permease [Burkholderiales bacterium]
MRTGPHVRLAEWVVIVTFVVMVVVTVAQVAGRYVFSYSLPWADELARYCLVWMVFIGMVVAFARGAHITADLLRERYHGRIGLVMLTVIDVANAALFIALLYGGMLLVQIAATQMTPGLGISKSWIYAALPLGAVLMLWELVRQIIARFRNPGLPDVTGPSEAPPPAL